VVYKRGRVIGACRVPTRAAIPAPWARWLDPAAIAAFIAYGLMVWWPTRNLPYFWDAAGLVVPAAHDMLKGGFWPLVPTHEYYAHPPLFIALVALAWRLFGDSRLVAHAVVLPFLPLAMTAIYLIGRRLHGRLVGFSAAALFGGCAVTLCEVGQVYFDLPVAAVAAFALLAWISGYPLLAGSIFAIATWMKIPAAMMPLGLASTLALDPSQRGHVRRWVGLAIPLAAAAAWFVYHHHVAGWWIAGEEHPMWVPSGVSVVGHRAAVFLRIVFLERYRWCLIVIAVAAVAILKRRREPLPTRELALLAVCIGAPLALFIASTFLTRYVLLILPAQLFFALLLARRAFSTTGFVMAVCGLLIAFMTTWHPTIPLTRGYELSPNEDLSYLDMIRIAERAGSYVEKKHSEAQIYGGFHEQYELGDPTMGYVHEQLDVRRCDHFWRDRVEQLIVIDAYSPEEVVCRLVASKTGASALTRFESNGKWLEMWRVPSP
jgi:hypothetical protein